MHGVTRTTRSGIQPSRSSKESRARAASSPVPRAAVHSQRSTIPASASRVLGNLQVDRTMGDHTGTAHYGPTSMRASAFQRPYPRRRALVTVVPSCTYCTRSGHASRLAPLLVATQPLTLWLLTLWHTLSARHTVPVHVVWVAACAAAAPCTATGKQLGWVPWRRGLRL